MHERFERFTALARRAFADANHAAIRAGSEYLRSAHLLMGILSQGDGHGLAILKRLGVDVEGLRAATAATFGPATAVEPDAHVPPPDAKRAIENAIDAARAFGHQTIGTHHLLMGLSDAGSDVSALLAAFNITRQRLREAVVEIVARVGPES